jgi:fumarate hydratase subunit beta
MDIIKLKTPLKEEDIKKLKIGDAIEISGTIYVGRDAVLPQIVEVIKNNKLDDYNLDLKGGVIFHSAVSKAGLGPTSSNKLEIEGTMEDLSLAGIKIHLGKGALSEKTVKMLNKYNSIFVVIPPITAYLGDKTITKKVAAFEKEGMEAFWELEVKGFPGIVAIAHGETIF